MYFFPNMAYFKNSVVKELLHLPSKGRRLRPGCSLVHQTTNFKTIPRHQIKQPPEQQPPPNLIDLTSEDGPANFSMTPTSLGDRDKEFPPDGWPKEETEIEKELLVSFGKLPEPEQNAITTRLEQKNTQHSSYLAKSSSTPIPAEDLMDFSNNPAVNTIPIEPTIIIKKKGAKSNLVISPNDPMLNTIQKDLPYTGLDSTGGKNQQEEPMKLRSACQHMGNPCKDLKIISWNMAGWNRSTTQDPT